MIFVSRIQQQPQRFRFIRHSGFAGGLDGFELFAELLSQGCTSEEAARRAGYSPCSAGGLLKRLKREFGDQAS